MKNLDFIKIADCQLLFSQCFHFLFVKQVFPTTPFSVGNNLTGLLISKGFLVPPAVKKIISKTMPDWEHLMQNLQHLQGVGFCYQKDWCLFAGFNLASDVENRFHLRLPALILLGINWCTTNSSNSQVAKLLTLWNCLSVVSRGNIWLFSRNQRKFQSFFSRFLRHRRFFLTKSPCYWRTW